MKTLFKPSRSQLAEAFVDITAPQHPVDIMITEQGHVEVKVGGVTVLHILDTVLVRVHGLLEEGEPSPDILNALVEATSNPMKGH